MQQALLKILTTLITIGLRPLMNFFVEVENQTPECCGDKVDFTGSHTSLFREELFYQCQECKMVFTIPNTHKGFSFGEFWRMIYMPYMGKKSSGLDFDCREK